MTRVQGTKGFCPLGDPTEIPDFQKIWHVQAKNLNFPTVQDVGNGSMSECTLSCNECPFCTLQKACLHNFAHVDVENNDTEHQQEVVEC